MSSENLHESPDVLSPLVIDRHRAIVSLMEELEAIDWYDQRAAAATDPELVKILEHNRDEEKEHAAMVLEWIRRNDSVMDKQLRTYLFSEGSIVEVEERAEGEAPEPTRGGRVVGNLPLGNLRGSENT
ncbi:MAG TPA: ferritin-like domain-containing protein [Microthrixaceae bacterium]|nr:ferritin-like domain-containing protein [Microthrixaceae bacterium]